MKDSFENWLANNLSTCGPPATADELRQLESDIGHRLPDQLRFLLTAANSPEGFVGKSYIAFFNASHLLQYWRVAQESAPGFIPFASDGGGELYGFDSRQATEYFLLMPAIGMAWSVATFLGGTWVDFWEALELNTQFDHDYPAPQG